jgi:hypothetical protein
MGRNLNDGVQGHGRTVHVITRIGVDLDNRA